MEFQRAIGGGGVVKRDRKKQGKKGKEVKVVYISTPMKVKTSAAGFRSLVQRLTGRHSDIARIMEANGGAACCEFQDFADDRSPPSQIPKTADPAVADESPTSSESQVDEQFEEVFPMDLFLNLSSFDLEDDVLGAY
ncbi:unnamed protein product [Cuscuta campestris]|uniref:VQ domain-containing protein n=1 Tax=Cuscuta campestris TaxID=132261 RepID=A0A484LHE8_9ASTE|nr:unnamed protein product [Cuscuta campestris]